MKKPLIVAALLISALPSMASSQRAIWKMPENAYFEALQMRPNGKIAVYYSRSNNAKKHDLVTRRVLLDERSKRVSPEIDLPHILMGTDIKLETFNRRGQHAYLPQGQVGVTNFLRLKMGNSYRPLKFIPPASSIEDMKFSPDGEVLKVLGKDRLWIIGAQTGKLLQIIRPQTGKWWSRENAELSPDGFTIVGMREKIMVFSARTGRLLNSFGIHVETETGHCGDITARVGFSPDGRSIVAGTDFETFYEFPATGGRMRWKGTIPYNLRTSPDSHLYLDFKYRSDMRGEYPIIRETHSHQIVDAFPSLSFDETFEPPVEFSSDGKSIYFVKDNTLWQRPIKVC